MGWRKLTSGGTSDHGGLTGLADVADHPYALLVDGSRPLTGTQAGVTPTADAHLATKGYVDSQITDPGVVWMPLTTVDTTGEPVLVWDDDDSLIPTEVPV